MSYIITRKIRNATYVYECKSYRNKEGRPRNKQHCLGKLDSDGVLITKKRKLPAGIRVVKTVTKHFIIEPYTPNVNKIDIPIMTNNDSTGSLTTAAKTAAKGERIIDASTHSCFTRPFSHKAQVRGMNTTHALKFIDRNTKRRPDEPLMTVISRVPNTGT